MIWFRYINYTKLVNLAKIYLSYLLSVLTKKVIVWGYPYSLTTEPTNNCNLSCIECPTGNKNSTRIKGFQHINLYKQIIDEAKNFAIYQMLYFQGEPFLHQQLFDMISYADDNKIYTCTSTNGHFLNQENSEKIVTSGLKKIIISLDGTDQGTYKNYRVNGNFELVISGIRNLVQAKKNLNSKYPKIHLQFLVFRHNEHQIPEIKKLAKSLKVDKLELKSVQIDNLDKNNHLIPSIGKYSRYSKKFPYALKTKFHNRCFRIWSTAVVSFEGTLIPCCFDKNLDFKIGNIAKLNIKELWKSSLFNDFRRKVFQNRKKNAICSNCSEGLRIKY